MAAAVRNSPFVQRCTEMGLNGRLDRSVRPQIGMTLGFRKQSAEAFVARRVRLPPDQTRRREIMDRLYERRESTQAGSASSSHCRSSMTHLWVFCVLVTDFTICLSSPPPLHYSLPSPSFSPLSSFSPFCPLSSSSSSSAPLTPERRRLARQTLLRVSLVPPSGPEGRGFRGNVAAATVKMPLASVL